ncbi:MAG TPA: DUF4345 domain-containing protein [Thermomonas sp.]|jgi:hypothetical protein|nr:DUF4345 domain-containing protein [Thermomonas sp.]
MTARYLWLNAVLFIAFAAWCALRAEPTAQALGFTAMDAGGRTEYLAVYGGLQLGLGLLFAWTARAPDRLRFGLLLALALYGPIVALRGIGLLRYGPVPLLTQVTAAGEALMLLLALALWFARRG